MQIELTDARPVPPGAGRQLVLEALQDLLGPPSLALGDRSASPPAAEDLVPAGGDLVGGVARCPRRRPRTASAMLSVPSPEPIRTVHDRLDARGSAVTATRRCARAGAGRPCRTSPGRPIPATATTRPPPCRPAPGEERDVTERRPRRFPRRECWVMTSLRGSYVLLSRDARDRLVERELRTLRLDALVVPDRVDVGVDSRHVAPDDLDARASACGGRLLVGEALRGHARVLELASPRPSRALGHRCRGTPRSRGSRAGSAPRA